MHIFALWVCYFHPFYSAAPLSCFLTQGVAALTFLSAFYVFYRLRNGNESVLEFLLYKSLVFLSSPFYRCIFRKGLSLILLFFTSQRHAVWTSTCYLTEGDKKKTKQHTTKQRKKAAVLFHSPQLRQIQRHMEGIQDESGSSAAVQNSNLDYSWEASFSIMWIYFLLTGSPK